jgi:hypothetical protein
VSWVETTAPSFTARHAEEDSGDVVALLELLEGTRERLAGRLPVPEERIAVIVHSSAAQLALAQPAVPVLRRLTAPASRRYVAGWFGTRELHVLAPRLLRERASAVPGSRELLELAPAGLYAQLAAGRANPALPPPFRPRSARALLRWAWLAAGTGQWFSGQTAHARPAIARRLREGAEPRFPPGIRDAQLLGGSVLDLLAREEGEQAVVRLALEPPDTPQRTLERAFRGRSLVHTSGAWRAHLARMAGP